MKICFSTVRKFYLLLLMVALNSIAAFAQKDTSLNLGIANKKSFQFGAGYINAGYEYGLTPYSLIDSAIGGYFSIDGNQQINIFGAPINVTGRYTTLKNVSGLNNNIRISFDASAYRQQLKERAKQKALSYKDSLLNLQGIEQNYMQRLQYLNYLNSLPKDQYEKLIEKQSQISTDTSIGVDTSQLQMPGVEISKPQFVLPTGPDYKSKLEDALHLQQTLLDSIRFVRSKIESVQHLHDSISSLSNPQLPDVPGLPFLSRVKKFEIGMCYPTFSPLSISGIPMKGFCTEYENGRTYFGVAAGRTISNLLFTQNILENNISNVRNLYNYFDFNQLESGRTIATVRGGFGSKERSHLIVGVLWGKGLQSYWQDSTTTLNPEATEQNIVVDVDAVFSIAKSHRLNFNYAKSVIHDGGFSSEATSISQPKLQDVNYRSHAALVRYEGSISATKTNITATVRWVDPYFKSYGAGFVRPDNVRIELKGDQQLSKKWKLQFLGKQEQNNLLRLYNQNTYLRSAGLGLTFKASSKFQFRVQYQPVLQVVSSDSINYRSDNQMLLGSLTWRPKLKRWNATISGLCNYLKLLDGATNREYVNALAFAKFQSKRGVLAGVNYSYFSITPNDSLFSDNGVVSIEGGYIGKKGFSILASYKLGHFSNSGIQSGGGVMISVPIWKQTSLIIEGQRLIRGDYFGVYSPELFKQFPYLISTHLQIHW